MSLGSPSPTALGSGAVVLHLWLHPAGRRERFHRIKGMRGRSKVGHASPSPDAQLPDARVMTVSTKKEADHSCERRGYNVQSIWVKTSSRWCGV
ncbi:hypothetical protein TNCV_1805151 [Trichonephila clavipes]|nr:hypothetical protein TNCV_1805151 [Trichonephila clavipes]